MHKKFYQAASAFVHKQRFDLAFDISMLQQLNTRRVLLKNLYYQGKRKFHKDLKITPRAN